MRIPERVLVILPNWFGEVLFATPLLRAIHQAAPRAYLAALGVPRTREVLEHNPDVQAFVTYEERGAHRTWRGKQALIAQLRQRRFDAAIILRRSLSRTLLLVFAGIPRRIGVANLKSGWFLTHRVASPRGPTHKAQAYLRLLEPFGLPPAAGSYTYYVSDEERAQADAFLRKEGYTDLPAAPSPLGNRGVAQGGGRPLIVLHAGANWAHKRWSTERFAELANRLAQRAATVVITGGPNDQPLLEAMRPRTAHPSIVVAGQTTLRQLAACLERASVVVSNDTGVLHIAGALGRPLVALYGPTSPAITGPLGDPARTIVIHHPDCCPRIPCYRPHHPGYPGMDAISVDEVYAAAEKLLIGGR